MTGGQKVQQILGEDMEKRDNADLIRLNSVIVICVCARKRSSRLQNRRWMRSAWLIEALRKKALTNENQLTRVHALWALGQIAHWITSVKTPLENRSPLTPWNENDVGR